MIERIAVADPPPTLPSRQEPAAGEIQVWLVDLEVEDDLVRHLAAFLSPDERRRAEDFRFERHRRRFTVGRGALRVLLSYLTGVPGARLSFRYGPHGKPASIEAPHLHFNVSHSSEQAAIAFARAGAVGIDIERVQDLEDADDLARHHFSRRETEAYFALAAGDRKRAFFDCWTRKEAFLKALGDGLSLALDRFDVSLSPGEAPRLLAVDGRAEAARRWCLQALDLGTDFAGALATEWLPTATTAWRLPPDLLAAGSRR